MQHDNNSKDEEFRQNQLLLRRPSVQNMFKGYQFLIEIKEREEKKKRLRPIQKQKPHLIQESQNNIQIQ
jgi:hypothetical protein